MQFTTLLVLALGAVSQAATITSAPAAASTSGAGLSSAVMCVNACEPSDVTCKASCLGAARPNASQVVDTNKCAAKCDQGDGSPAAATAFSNCVQGCINSLFPSSQTAFGGNGSPGGSSAPAASGASATTGSTRPSSSAAAGSNSASGSGAAPQQTGAADSNSARLAGAGLAGLLAVFAL